MALDGPLLHRVTLCFRRATILPSPLAILPFHPEDGEGLLPEGGPVGTTDPTEDAILLLTTGNYFDPEVVVAPRLDLFVQITGRVDLWAAIGSLCGMMNGDHLRRPHDEILIEVSNMEKSRIDLDTIGHPQPATFEKPVHHRHVLQRRMHLLLLLP